MGGLAPFIKGVDRGHIPTIAQRATLAKMMVSNANRLGLNGD